MAEIVSTAPIARTDAPVQTKAPVISALDRQLPVTSGRILVRRAIKVTAEHFGMTPAVLVSRVGTRLLSRRRQVAMYVAREMTGRSLKFIGSKVGDRHHATILYGVRTIKCLLDAGDAEVAAAVEAIVRRLQVTRGSA